MNNETTCFLCTSSVLVRRCLSCRFHGDEAAFGLRREKKAGRSKDSQFVFLSPPPPVWTWTLPNPSVAPHGLTCGRFPPVCSFCVPCWVFHAEQGGPVPSVLSRSDMLGFVSTSVQSDVQVWRAEAGLCVVGCFGLALTQIQVNKLRPDADRVCLCSVQTAVWGPDSLKSHREGNFVHVSPVSHSSTDIVTWMYWESWTSSGGHSRYCN